MRNAQKHEECVAFKNKQKNKRAKFYAILTSYIMLTFMHVTFDDVIFVMSQKLYMKLKL